MRYVPFILAGLSLTLGGLGCGDSGPRVPPEISDLHLGDSTEVVGTEEAIHGVFAFTDPNGDVAEIAFEVTLPDGTVDERPPEPVDGLHKLKYGSVTFSLSYPRDQIGRYDVTVWLIDRAGLPSNRLSDFVYSWN